jgi:hypothetical protein
MRLVGFSAEASLYKTSGQYRSSVLGGRLAVLMSGAVRPAMEVIEIEGCAPGFLQLGEGDNMVCIPDPSWAGNGGDTGPGLPGGGRGGGGGETGDGTKTNCRKPIGRIQVQGCNWQNDCAGKNKWSCCRNQRDACLNSCNSFKTDASRQECKTECSASYKVCRE